MSPPSKPETPLRKRPYDRSAEAAAIPAACASRSAVRRGPTRVGKRGSAAGGNLEAEAILACGSLVFLFLALDAVMEFAAAKGEKLNDCIFSRSRRLPGETLK